MKNCRGFLRPRQSCCFYLTVMTTVFELGNVSVPPGPKVTVPITLSTALDGAVAGHILSDDHGLWRLGAALGGSAKGRVWISLGRQDRANELRPSDAIHGCRCASATNSSASVVHRHSRRIDIDGQSVWSEDGENNIWSGREGCVGDGPGDVTCLIHVGIWNLSISRNRDRRRDTGNGRQWHGGCLAGSCICQQRTCLRQSRLRPRC